VIPTGLFLAAVYAVFLWLDGREARAERQRVEREIDALERQESGEC
jgi:hypothetical protein